MKGIFPFVCLVAMVAAVVKSQRKIRTVVYGVLAGALILAASYALTEGLDLNAFIMANASVSLMFVITAYTMWTHARTTMKKTETEIAAAETTTNASPSNSTPST